jgi:hypothetical protein
LDDRIRLVSKPATEFFDAEEIAWSPAPGQSGVSQRILAADPGGRIVTRMVRWEPGLDTSGVGPVAHDYFEEVLILSGSLHDLSLDRIFSAGWYACRPPGMVHGPWRTTDGCVMFETRY